MGIEDFDISTKQQLHVFKVRDKYNVTFATSKYTRNGTDIWPPTSFELQERMSSLTLLAAIFSCVGMGKIVTFLKSMSKWSQ